MEIHNQKDVERYLVHRRSFLLHHGRQWLADESLVEDVMQELAAWTLAQVDQGRVFNDSYLFPRFRSLLRDACRASARIYPEVEQAVEMTLDRRLDAQRVIARIMQLPHGELVVDAIELGMHEAARRHGLKVGAVYTRVHRLRQQLHQEFPEGAAA